MAITQTVLDDSNTYLFLIIILSIMIMHIPLYENFFFRGLKELRLENEFNLLFFEKLILC